MEVAGEVEWYRDVVTGILEQVGFLGPFSVTSVAAEVEVGLVVEVGPAVEVVALVALAAAVAAAAVHPAAGSLLIL